jgi:hypothetical protein
MGVFLGWQEAPRLNPMCGNLRPRGLKRWAHPRRRPSRPDREQLPRTAQEPAQRQAAGGSTKYLSNSVAWMRLHDWFKDQGAKPEQFVLSGLGQQLITC